MFHRYIVLFAALCLFSGCKRSLQPTFEHFSQLPQQFQETKGQITCRAKLLSYEEVFALFGSDLISRGYQPVFLEIINNSQDTYYLSARTLSAPLASDVLVKEQLYWPTNLMTWTSSLVAAIFCWPAIPLVVLPSAYLLSSKNAELDHFMQEYSLKAHDRSFYIFPQECMKKICFIYGWERGMNFEIGLINDRTATFIKFLVKL